MYCEACGANYVLGDREKYVCSSYVNGRACSNDVRVPRDTAEGIVLERLRSQLRGSERVAAMVAEMQGYSAELLKENAAREKPHRN
jgi:site-specific DNA recombinase